QICQRLYKILWIMRSTVLQIKHCTIRQHKIYCKTIYTMSLALHHQLAEHLLSSHTYDTPTPPSLLLQQLIPPLEHILYCDPNELLVRVNCCKQILALRNSLTNDRLPKQMEYLLYHPIQRELPK